MSITVVEQRVPQSIFIRIRDAGKLGGDAIKLYNYLDETHSWDLFENLLKSTFPNGTYMDEYFVYVLSHAKYILDYLKGK